MRSTMNCRSLLFLALVVSTGSLLAEDRINHVGRILGPEPVVTEPVLFNTPQADAILSAMQIMPVDSPWNEDVSHRPLLANSSAMIARIRSDLAESRRGLRAFHEMNFVLVSDDQALRAITFTEYPSESDPGPYPIPANMPVETWPRETGSLSLQQWQQDVGEVGGDRHAIIVAPGSGGLWEMWQARLVGGQWRASNGARFDLRSNALRPAGWTSADAAGLPMFPGVVRYDETSRGLVEHAIRMIVRRTRREYVYPATHYASSIPATERDVPAMGQRLRLRASFPVPDHWSIHEKAVVRALKRFGAIVADNGNFFSISVTPDDRYPSGAFANLASIDVGEFEVVQGTGPLEGPRSPGAPMVDAGPDLSVPVNAPATLTATATGASLTYEWSKYAGPGAVTFGKPAAASTTVSFSASGAYTLMVRASDGVHAAAYDAVHVTVGAGATGESRSRLQNLSTRGFVGTGDAVMIAGFVIAGPDPKTVLIRAAGPGLAALGVAGTVADPVLTVLSGDTVVAGNDNWDPALASEFARAGAFEWAPGSADAAVIVTLDPGAYTARVNGANGQTGVAIVEVYEL